jgi:predicted porin
MKKILYGSTALVAMGALSAPAMATDPIQIGISGNWHFLAGMELGGQNDGVGEPGENKRSHAGWHESEVIFSGETTLDNGITIGVNVQLEGETTGDQVDENYAYFEGNFGRLELGEIDGVAYRTALFLPSAYFYQGPNYGSVIWGSNGGNANSGAWTYAGTWTGDNARINYFTPRINGFQLGVSYAPELCALDGEYTGPCGTYNNLFAPDSDPESQSEVWEVGTNYRGNLGDMSLGLSAGYSQGSLEAPDAELEDRNEWGVHGTLGSGAFTIGAGYREDNNGKSTANSDTTAWGISGNYRMDPWTFGAGYIVQQKGAYPEAGEDEVNAFAVGVDYALGPGITLLGGIDRYNYEDNDNNPENENSFTSLTVGGYISF